MNFVYPAEESSFWNRHLELARYNQLRLDPGTPSDRWREELMLEMKMRLLEGELLEEERRLIQDHSSQAPTGKVEFMAWFEDLKRTAPGQNDPLFDWLAETATYEQMRWFIKQEVAGEAGFEDLTALTQVKIPTQAKLEMARNYWDEMGKGRESGMHGPMLARIADEFEIDASDLKEITPEALALSNVMLGMAMNRRYAFHSIGALGAIELTAPGRADKVHQGLKRLGMSAEGQRYYLLHSTLDIKHSIDWNREVLSPILDESPEVASAIAEGALMRLNAGARTFERYRSILFKA